MLLKLGDTRLGIITKGIESERDQRSLARQCCQVVPKSKIKSESGTIGGLKIESLLPKTSATGKPLSLVGRRGDAHISETRTGTRTFQAERYSEGRDYDDGQAGDELFREVKAVLAPAIERQINFDVDLKFLEIYSGAGSAANSRDVSTYTLQAGEEFDVTAATSKPLFHFETALDLCGGDFIFMSTDIAQVLRRHPELMSALTANNRAVLSYRQLADVLMEQTNATMVQIGRRMYQDGGEFQNLKINYKFREVCGVGVKDNVLLLDYIPTKFKEYEVESKSVTVLQADHWSDIVVADPALTYAFDNLLAA
jgi:hypothetical protein